MECRSLQADEAQQRAIRLRWLGHPLSDRSLDYELGVSWGIGRIAQLVRAQP